MDASVISYRLSLLLRMIDTTNGAEVEERNVRILRDGQVMHPVSRGNGIYVFLNMEREDCDLDIQIFGYDSSHVQIQYEDLDSQMPIKEVFLIPSENTKKGQPVITLSGNLPGMESIQAVKLGTTSCCISEFDERKRIIKLFRAYGSGMNDIYYGLIHPGRQTYEPIMIEKMISETSVKISQSLKTPFSVNSPISRIIFGSVTKEGGYCLRVRDDTESLMYLVRYVAAGEARFKTVDFRHLEEVVLE